MALGRTQRHAQCQSAALMRETGGSAARAQTGSDSFDAWLQNPDPFIDGQISAVPPKVPSLQKTACISL